LAWALDAALKDRSCGDKRLSELMQIFHPYDKKQGRKKRRFDEDGGGSTSQPDENTVLGEMGMILRDPPVYFFLAREALKRLQRVVEHQALPKQDAPLIFLSRLLQIATDCRSMLREKSFKFYKVDEGLVRDFYPKLAASFVDKKMQKLGKEVDTKAVDPYYLGEWLYSHNVTHTVGQVVYQVFVIDCLAKNELDIGQQALMTIASVLPKITSKAIVEWSPFMYSLAERLQSMVKAKAIRVTDDLWKLAVDSILVKAVHCEVEVHRHVLQLVDVSSGQLAPHQLVAYLETMLEVSEKSRKRYRKKQAKLAQEQQSAAADTATTASAAGDGNGTSPHKVGSPHRYVNDGVHEAYSKLVGSALKGKLNEENAPKLLEYVKQRGVS